MSSRHLYTELWNPKDVLLSHSYLRDCIGLRELMVTSIQWLIDAGAQGPDRINLTQDNSKDPWASHELVKSIISPTSQLNFFLSPLLLLSLPSLQVLIPRTLPNIHHARQTPSQSLFSRERTQPVEFSLISFLFQRCSWVLYFLASWWHLFPFSLELPTHLLLQPFSVGLTTRKYYAVTHWILLA